MHLDLRISPQIFGKIQNDTNVNFRDLGEDDSWKKLKQKVSLHCPFNCPRLSRQTQIQIEDAPNRQYTVICIGQKIGLGLLRQIYIEREADQFAFIIWSGQKKLTIYVDHSEALQWARKAVCGLITMQSYGWLMFFHLVSMYQCYLHGRICTKIQVYCSKPESFERNKAWTKNNIARAAETADKQERVKFSKYIHMSHYFFLRVAK